MDGAEPWQRAEVPGPLKGLTITKPEVVAAIIKGARRPLLIVGHEVVKVDFGGEGLIDYLISMAKEAEIPIVATAYTVGKFIRKGFNPSSFMSFMDIANRLLDVEWMGLDGLRRYDLALFIGVPYYMGWVGFSALKHYLNLKTICLDRFYQPHASWSFLNISLEDWRESLKVVVDHLKGG